MKLSTRYGLVGMGALGALSLVHWGRRLQVEAPQALLYLIGVLPSVAAAIAIPFVLLSIWADQNPAATYPDARRSFVLLLAVTGVGLVAWELIQRASRTLVFDSHDIGATIVGLGVGWFLFNALTPRARSLDDRRS